MDPIVVAALIAAVPATVGAWLTWRGNQKGKATNLAVSNGDATTLVTKVDRLIVTVDGLKGDVDGLKRKVG